MCAFFLPPWGADATDGLGELTLCDVRADLGGGPDPARIRVTVAAGGDGPVPPARLDAVERLARQFVREVESLARSRDLG